MCYYKKHTYYYEGEFKNRHCLRIGSCEHRLTWQARYVKSLRRSALN